ncbi:hypothetical protein GE09DRAFT_1228871 [Coniochaeta sp. 2T2.1]|nr:hypothetical protein GE09DRAFT_1228871 [Coniochaeta sp. 2T2.1]
MAGMQDPRADELRKRGNDLYKQGKLCAAEVSYKAAASLAPGDPTPLANLSCVKYELGQYSEAVDFIQQSLKLMESGPADEESARKSKALYDRLAKSFIHAPASTMPARIDTPQYWPMGHDTAEPLFDDALRKSCSGGDSVSLMFCGSGDARNVFATISAMANHRQATQARIDAHITLMDVNPAAIARMLIFIDMAMWCDVTCIAHQVPSKDQLTMIAYIYAAQFMPAAIDKVLQHLPHGQEGPQAQDESIFEDFHRANLGLDQPVQNGVELDTKILRDLGVLLPPKSFAKHHDPQIVKLMENYHEDGSVAAVAELEEYIDANWVTNKTFIDLDLEDALATPDDYPVFDDPEAKELFASAYGPGALAFTCQGYQIWERVPSNKLAHGELLHRPLFEKWLHGHFLKICHPYPRDKLEHSELTAPFNLTFLIRLVVHLSEIGYPAHWLSGVLSVLCNGNGELITTARPPVGAITSPTDVDAIRPAKKMTIGLWQAEFTTLLSIWSRLLPFGFIAPDAMVPPTDIAEFSITFPHFPRQDFLLDAENEGNPPVTPGKIKPKLAHIFTAMKYVTATRTASFWCRRDVVQKTKEGKWDAYIWRIDEWRQVSGGVAVKDAVAEIRAWTE